MWSIIINVVNHHFETGSTSRRTLVVMSVYTQIKWKDHKVSSVKNMETGLPFKNDSFRARSPGRFPKSGW